MNALPLWLKKKGIYAFLLQTTTKECLLRVEASNSLLRGKPNPRRATRGFWPAMKKKGTVVPFFLPLIPYTPSSAAPLPFFPFFLPFIRPPPPPPPTFILSSLHTRSLPLSLPLHGCRSRPGHAAVQSSSTSLSTRRATSEKSTGRSAHAHAFMISSSAKANWHAMESVGRDGRRGGGGPLLLLRL